jgi:large subunit ribosomal protein L23
VNIYDVILRPITTEKVYRLRPEGKYAFEVAPKANKHEVKAAVEKAFEVNVVAVNMINIPPKRRRVGRRWIVSQPQRRKAIVKLAAGQSIRALETA